MNMGLKRSPAHRTDFFSTATLPQFSGSLRNCLLPPDTATLPELLELLDVLTTVDDPELEPELDPEFELEPELDPPPPQLTAVFVVKPSPL